MHDDYDLRQEQLNKSSLLSSKSFLQGLLDLFGTHVVSEYQSINFSDHAVWWDDNQISEEF